MSTTKKGGQKPSRQPPPLTNYEFRDIVLGKVRGFPSWPGMIVDPDTVPAAVRKERPGGKKISVYCVRFFPKGDYAWLASKDISKLQTHEIESYITEPHKKNGELFEGYKIALDPKEWEESMAESMAAAGEVEANAEVDQLDSEGDSNEGSTKKSKKRKRESDAASTVKAKTPKKPRQSKKGSEEPAPGKSTTRKGAAGAKSRKSAGKSKAMVESEDEAEVRGDAEGESADGPSKATGSPPPAKKGKRNDEDDLDGDLGKDVEAVKVREWRHKLQKTFLSPKVTPKSEEMPVVNNLFTTIETYDNMTVQYLQFSKIGKVMRHIAALDTEKVPRDPEFKFRDRAKALVDKWHLILNKSANGTSPSAPIPIAVNGSGPAEEANGHIVAVQGDVSAGGVEEKTAALDLNGQTDQPDVSQDETADAPGSVIDPSAALPNEQVADVIMTDA